MNELDRASLQILEALQADARLSTQALADKVGLSATPVWRRVKDLEDRGVIRGQVVLVDREKVGLSILVLAHVSLVRHSEGAVEQFELARESGMSSANFHYNLGLAYFQVQDYEKARIQAYKAKEMGYELDGLKKLLMKAGQWRDPPPVAPKPPEGAQQKAEGSKTERSAAPAN